MKFFSRFTGRLTSLFRKQPKKKAPPEPTVKIVESPKEVVKPLDKKDLKVLDSVADVNQREINGTEIEIQQVKLEEAAFKEELLKGDISPRRKISVLQNIAKCRKRLNSLERRLKIHHDNIDVHLGLYDRLSEMESMTITQVSEQQIEEISIAYDEKLEEHREILSTLRESSFKSDFTSDKEELQKLEQEILAERKKLLK